MMSAKLSTLGRKMVYKRDGWRCAPLRMAAPCARASCPRLGLRPGVLAGPWLSRRRAPLGPRLRPSVRREVGRARFFRFGRMTYYQKEVET